MLIRNIDVNDGLANGSQGTVVDFIFSHNSPVAILIKFDQSRIGENARRNSKYDLSQFSDGATPVESHLLLFMNDHKRLGFDFMSLFNIVLT